jgi:hypothetical protein
VKICNCSPIEIEHGFGGFSGFSRTSAGQGIKLKKSVKICLISVTPALAAGASARVLFALERQDA